MQFTYKESSTIESSIIDTHKSSLSTYISKCQQVVSDKNFVHDESSLCLVDDEVSIKSVIELVKKKGIPELKYIIDIGIGGSNLGTKAIYDALLGYGDMFKGDRFPKMFFLDTSDPEYIEQLVSFLNENVNKKEEIAINIISKSGGTTETAVNTEIILDLLKSKISQWQERCVVTTDKNSPLWNSAVELGIDVLEIPKKVGGRYSVFSAVGLFPLALCGLNIRELLSGAKTMRDKCLTSGEENIALSSAALLYEYGKRGTVIHDNFYFHSELESLGKWYRQLVGESTGKQGMGLTPTVSVGSVDLHSVVQLYLGGPKNRATSFVYTNTFKNVLIPKKNTLSHLKEIEGKTVGEIMNAIQQGTITAYKKSNLPITETIFDSISEGEIGAYMQFKMMEIMFLSSLMHINAFDQPQVELYKNETKKILGAK